MAPDPSPLRAEEAPGSHRILVVDDDVSLLKALLSMLEKGGFTVECCTTGEDALERARAGRFDAIVLDAILPGIHGLDVATALRDGGCTTPILMLTGVTETDFLVEALSMGADDFVGKPFRARELEARIRALIRRGRVVPQLQVGPFLIHPLERTVNNGDDSLRLTGMEMRILLALVSAEGDYVSHDDLLTKIWGMDFDPGTNLVYTHITNLRRKLGRLGAESMIQSSRGQGYRVLDA